LPPQKLWSIVIVVLMLTGGALAARWLVGSSAPDTPQLHPSDLEALSGSASSRAAPAGAGTWPVIVNNPEGPPRIATGELDSLGRPVTVSCSSCHSNLPPDSALRRSTEDPPMEFHRGLSFHHGNLSCISCHNQSNYDTLRLVDGTPLSFPNVMSMCAQCHSPQARDWERGAHGGMTGHWDLTRGGRLRKNCIDCHDPHHPALTPMTPTFKPRDRFLYPPTPHAGDKGHGHE
jgi:hypothetical protein